jgi:hypothetical protein
MSATMSSMTPAPVSTAVPTVMSALIQLPIDQLEKFLEPHKITLKKTVIEDTYLIKFTPETPITDPMISCLKGLLFNHKTKEIYSLTYPVPLEMKDLPETTQTEICNKIKQQPHETYEALDGTLLRFSNIPNKGWLLSTNGKEDANQAFWMNGHSFAEQFWSAKPPINPQQLNPNYVYMFVLCHPLNIIVVNHAKPRVYHVATYDRRTFTEVETDLGIEKPTKMPMTVDQVVESIQKSQTKPVTSAGYMVLVRDDTGRVNRFRFENHNYTLARDLRGESNNLQYLLLSYMLDHTAQGQQGLVEFLQYYPVYQKDVEVLWHRIDALCNKFYREYGLRYKEHRSIFVHQRHHRFLSEIHTQVYLAQLREQKKTVQFEHIKAFLLRQPTARVLYLLNYVLDL